jgi:hypothetical protein
MIRIPYFCIATLLSVGVTGSAFAACPPNSSVSYESGSVVHCKCDAGYENREGGCKPIPTMNPAPAATMGPMTRAMCMKFQDEIQSDGTGGCRWGLYSCIKQGIGFPAAWCAIGIVFAKVEGRLATAVATAGCGERLQNIVSACEPKFDACNAEVAAAYTEGTGSCPSD